MHNTILSLAALASLSKATVYTLKENQVGQAFFDSFSFLGGYNASIQGPIWDWPDAGDDFWANYSTGIQMGMFSIDKATNDVILKVDNTPVIDFNQKRYSFRAESNVNYGAGSLFVFDAVHLPFGCAIWPAYWLVSTDWPAGGEIDVMESINLRDSNQYAFHTGGPCLLDPPTGAMTGQLRNTNCTTGVGAPGGCTVGDPSPDSYGVGFNSAEGGMWITEFATDVINIWFWSRVNVPAAVTTESNATSIDTSALGEPVAQLATGSSCDVSTFTPQKVIFDVTLCGSFAGVPSIANGSGCPIPANSSCYATYVVGTPETPANFSEGYFQIKSHRVFTVPGETTVPNPNATASSTSGSGTQTSGGSGSSKTSGGGSGGNNSAVGIDFPRGVFGALVLSAFALLL